MSFFKDQRANLVSPSGIMGGGTDSLTSTHTQGRFKKYYWRDLQPTSSTNFQWTDLDGQVASALANNHKFTLLLNLNSGNPAGTKYQQLPQWLETAGAVFYFVHNDNHDEDIYSVLSWDPVVLAYALNLIAAIGARYDGKIHSISMGGFGLTTEWGIILDDGGLAADGKSTAAARAAWIVSSETLMMQYAANFHSTTFVAALSQVGLDDLTLQTVVDYGLNLFGTHLGFENWGLNANSTTGYLPNSIIYNHRTTNPVGFQMTGNATTGTGGNLQGTLREAMEAGVAMGAHYLQVFGEDTANPIYFTDLDEVSAELLAQSL